MTLEQLYDQAIKLLAPSERFRLATMILNQIPPQSVVDVHGDWSDADLQEVVAYSAQIFASAYPEGDELVDAG